MLYLLDEMQLPRVFKWGNCGESLRFISVVTNSFCLTLVASNQPPHFGPSADAYICSSPKRFIFYILYFLLGLADPQTHRGPFIRGISSPQLLRAAPGSLPIYYHCKAPCLCPPPLQNLYKNIFERLSLGSVMPWQHLQHYRLPAPETISCFTHHCGEITKETSLTNHIRILAQSDGSAARC